MTALPAEPQPAMPPDRRALEAHLTSAEFATGVEQGAWELLAYDWPVAVIAVSASSRPNAPNRFALRIDLTGYPVSAPTSTPWDAERDAVLAPSCRPKGENVGMVFRSDWEGGRALYAPYDRVALAGHGGWLSAHPRYAWNATRTLSWLLWRVFDLLNCDDYVGV